MEQTDHAQRLQQTNSEEITFLVSRIPSSISIQISILISIILLMLIIGLFTIKYPDSYKGSVTIVADNPSLSVVANHQGPIIILKNDHDVVNRGDIVAYIDNEASFEEMLELEKTALNFNSDKNLAIYYDALPKIVHYGEINNSYFTFLNALQQYVLFTNNGLYDRQQKLLDDLAKKQEKQLHLQRGKVSIINKNDRLSYNKVKRDSLLRNAQVISQEQFESTEQNYLNTLQYNNTTKQEIYKLDQEILSTKSKSTETQILKVEKREKLISDLYNSYNDLINKIRAWKRAYLITAPTEGKVQYLSFLKNNQYINHQDPIFAIVPISNKVNGQMMISDFGSGKIKENQDVLIRLNNFPHEEYGIIKAKVMKISFVGNTIKTANGEEKRYMVDLAILPSGGSVLLSDGVSGEGEILTNNKKLYERVLEKIMLTFYKKA
ncbi:HlyD family efflux transporter periplasmic adaptor subunit [Chryseobacterium jejuense]|uniref:HlyD family efflux transporter periplasmic adaptor subunit n=1 Tax=Chryseobacterium jejuense TaxID=445960 RepID=UPI001AE4F358|nr:HlyD family efflux transporter periplasmic adaptor subunit [Chryseobacterium jejuense]MBP2616645.1 multidrug efflux pump subunit AcrA (membrane-fusion protein) [Chryseobacterium jejuense]